jgi:hypothetical protein
MTLVDFLQKHTAQWAAVFAQARTLERAVALSFGILCGLGKRTITRAICFQGNAQKDWSADYKVFSRSPWEPRDLFTPILQHAIQEHGLQRLVFSADDTRVWRTGKHVPQTQWHRDPMGPAFHTNLRWGHRFLQASLVLPLYQHDSESSARTIPVRFEMAPVVKKPGQKAAGEDWVQYRKEKKEKNLSMQFVQMTRQLREHLDQSGHAQKSMTMVVDGSFCNKTVFTAEGKDGKPLNVSIVARCRKDIVLCKRARDSSRRFYGQTKFTPEMARKRDSIAPWQTTQIFHGGCYREVRYKELSGIYWQGGARKKPVRLLVVAPTGYRTSQNGRKYYRQPAYLLTTDLNTPAAVLLQDYFDRWGIEVNHRDEKEILGVGQAQVWNEQSVSKVPAFLVAMYSWLLLGGLACYGPRRTEAFQPLPKWRRGAKRPSCLDLVTLLRRQLHERPIAFPTGAAPPAYPAMVGTAAA